MFPFPSVFSLGLFGDSKINHYLCPQIIIVFIRRNRDIGICFISFSSNTKKSRQEEKKTIIVCCIGIALYVGCSLLPESSEFDDKATLEDVIEISLPNYKVKRYVKGIVILYGDFTDSIYIDQQWQLAKVQEEI